MDTLAPPKISAEAYLEQERQGQEKHEYHDGIIVPMSGASIIHTIICGNIYALVWNFTRNRDFTAHTSDLRVFVPKTQRYVYPGVVIIQGEPAVTDERKDVVTNPMLVVEILSESTEAYDRGDKFESYRTIDSLQEYVLVSQEKPHIEVFSRDSIGSVWKLTEASGLESSIELPALGLTLSLTNVYAKVNFEERI